MQFFSATTRFMHSLREFAPKGDEQSSALSPGNRKLGERDPLLARYSYCLKIDRWTKTAKSGSRNNSYDLPKEICARSRQYGYRHVHFALRRQGWNWACNRETGRRSGP